jgi:type II secretory pathway component GspD/PulD (secretin)
MTPIKSLAFILSVILALNLGAAEPPDQAPSPTGTPPESAEKNGTATTTATNSAAVAATEPAATTPSSDSGTNLIRMNFRGASLDMVLSYLSEAAGFIINVKPGASVRGKVDVWSSDPVTREEALNLLDTVLNQNNLAAVRNGRTLTIVNRDEAKTQNIPVTQGSDPDKIPMTDKIVTQIMPVRFVEVSQLVKDLQPLVSIQTTMTANEAGNAIVMTDTQANIHKVAEVIHAIDLGAEEFTEVRVFHLDNSDPTEIADMITNLFPDDSRQGNSQSPMATNPFFSRFGGGRFGGGFGGAGGGGAGNAGGASNTVNQRIKKRNRVIAVADQRTTSVIVSASRDLMDQIEVVVKQLDDNKQGKQGVYVFELRHATPAEVLTPLQDSFGGNNAQNSRTTTSATQNDALQGRSTSQNQQNNAASRTTSTSGRGVGGGGGGGGGTFP